MLFRRAFLLSLATAALGCAKSRREERIRALQQSEDSVRQSAVRWSDSKNPRDWPVAEEAAERADRHRAEWQELQRQFD